MHHLFWLFLHWTGSDNVSGPFYGFWSGFGSDIAEFAIIGAVVRWYNHHKCYSCPRVGKYEVVGTAWKTCHKHTTEAHHATLHQEHKRKHPLQHRFLNKEEQI